MVAGGDLGRRIVERRTQLGLSREDVAHRAGMDVRYLESLEESPSSNPSRAALWRLSAALETTVDAITGAGMLAPPGASGAPGGRAVLEQLDADTCRDLVAPGGVGRVVFSDTAGPVAYPVNFKMLDGAVIFRTAESSPFARPSPPDPVSFEVDHIDEALLEGWSVLMTGSARAVDPKERDRVQALDLHPWPGEERNVYVKLLPSRITGRRIRRL